MTYLIKSIDYDGRVFEGITIHTDEKWENAECCKVLWMTGVYSFPAPYSMLSQAYQYVYEIDEKQEFVWRLKHGV